MRETIKTSMWSWMWTTAKSNKPEETTEEIKEENDNVNTEEQPLEPKEEENE